MTTLVDINIKKKKNFIYALRNVYGLGLSSSKKVCKNLGYDINTNVIELKQEDLIKINALVNVKYKFIIEAELKKEIYDKIQIMKNIKSYKGVRHHYNLPVNGQRTHTNGKTRG